MSDGGEDRTLGELRHGVHLSSLFLGEDVFPMLLVVVIDASLILLAATARGAISFSSMAFTDSGVLDPSFEWYWRTDSSSGERCAANLHDAGGSSVNGILHGLLPAFVRLPLLGH